MLYDWLPMRVTNTNAVVDGMQYVVCCYENNPFNLSLNLWLITALCTYFLLTGRDTVSNSSTAYTNSVVVPIITPSNCFLFVYRCQDETLVRSVHF